MKRKLLTLAVLAAAATITLTALYARQGDAAPTFTTEAISRGDIVNVVSSSGTLQAVTMVQVGSQVSGTVEALAADFNSIVRQGQVLARLDQSNFASAVEQARASLVNAEAEVERLQVAREAAESALARAKELTARQLLPAADLQTADTASRSAAAQVVGAHARLVQARAAVEAANVNLAKTVIRSPIDGVVIARNVDVGQTVAASLSAPTLFVIAADLSKMQVNASIDESDLGQVAADQTVSFRVDAYPSESFRGRVAQVRLNPTTANNVVTYAAIIDAPNPELKLKPGMTATVTIEVARREDVLRVPAAALRFKPTADVLATQGVKAPAGKSPTLWVSTNGQLSATAVQVGATDATYAEILSPALPEGTQVVTRAVTAASTVTAAPAAANNPLMPSRPTPRR